jgi:hypothetical protein
MPLPALTVGTALPDPPFELMQDGKLSQSFRGFHADADSAWNELGEAFSARR